MSGWRHVWRDGDECMGHEGKFLCGCTTPTPDPASPCGTIRFGLPCGFRAADHTPTGHPHQPTRCTCGHSIEPVR